MDGHELIIDIRKFCNFNNTFINQVSLHLIASATSDPIIQLLSESLADQSADQISYGKSTP